MGECGTLGSTVRAENPSARTATIAEMTRHEHALKHDGSGRNFSLYEEGYMSGRSLDQDNGHSHENWSRLDLVHDHGGHGPHHHHLRVIDNYASLLYWGPAWHDTTDRSPDRDPPVWVLERLDDLPEVLSPFD